MKKYKEYKFKNNIKNPDLFLYFPKYYINHLGRSGSRYILKLDNKSVKSWDEYINRFLKNWRKENNK